MRARTLARRLGLLACRCATHQVAQRPVILAYHRVGSPGGVALGEFARQVDYLAERFRVVPLAGLRAAWEENPEALPASITFDDGTEDHAEAAASLEARGLRGTFFLIPPLLGQVIGQTPYLSLDQARELAERGHELGAHTLTHPRLSRVGLEEAWQEVAGSKAHLEEQIGVPVVSFAYPKGDHNQAVRDMVDGAGYRTAVTIREGLLRSRPDWLTLPRHCVQVGESLATFRACLHPGVELYERLVGR